MLPFFTRAPLAHSLFLLVLQICLTLHDAQKTILTELAYAVSKNMSFYRHHFTSVELFSDNFCGSRERLQNFCPAPRLKLHTAEPIYLSGLWDVCTHNTFIVISSGHINDYHPSSYLCLQRSVRRCGAHAVRDHGLNRLRPFSCVRYDIAA